MTERFPRQRNRRSATPQRPSGEPAPSGAAPAQADRRAGCERAPLQSTDERYPAPEPQDDDASDLELVFDESFVAAAPVKEASALARMIEAGLRYAPDPGRPGPGDRVPTAWMIRPSHRLRSLRTKPLLWMAAAGAGTLLLLLLLR